MLLKKTVLSLCIPCLAFCFQSCQQEVREDIPKSKPNFLIIISDDQTHDAIQALGNTEIITPNLDKLVESGVTFTHAFNQGSWAGAVCVSSRSMLITGQTVFRAAQNTKYLDYWAQLYGPAHYQLRKEPDKVYKESEVKIWPEVFSDAGYTTFLTGKWHNSEYSLLKGFNEAHATGEGMYETFDQKESNKMAYSRPNESDWTPWSTDFSGHWKPRVKDILYTSTGEKVIGAHYTVEQHTSELYADRAINFLQTKVKNDDNPFFMYVAFNAPHDPRQSPKEYIDMYSKETLEIPDNFLPEHPFDQGDHNIRDERLAVFPRTKQAVQLHKQEYYAIISHFDHQMGRILAALKDTGKADNTHVIFTSDHGLAVGQHGLMGKQNQYDHSIRMPLIIAGPNLEKGKKVHEMIYMQSLYATTCGLADINTPPTVEFKSLEKMIQGNGGDGEEYIFGSYRHLQRMIRSDEYKLIVYPEAKRVQLFNIKNDPKEIVDLSYKSEYRDTALKLFDRLVSKQEGLEDFLVLNADDYFKNI